MAPPLRKRKALKITACVRRKDRFTKCTVDYFVFWVCMSTAAFIKKTTGRI